MVLSEKLRRSKERSRHLKIDIARSRRKLPSSCNEWQATGSGWGEAET